MAEARLQASTLPLPARTLYRPLVHPWMTAEADVAGRVGARLDDLLPRLESALDTLGAEQDATQRLLLAIGRIRAGFDGLSTALDGHGSHVRSFSGSPRGLMRLRAHTDALSAADAACRAALLEAGAMLPTCAELLSGGLAAAPTTPADTACEGESDATQLRTALAVEPVDDVRLALARRPEVAALLADDTPPQWLAAHVRDEASVPRLLAVREACAGAGAQELERAALLHPRVVGGLDGVPIATRVRANRSVLRADLSLMRRADATFEELIGADSTQGSWARMSGRLLDAWLANEDLAGLVTIAHDRPLVRRAEHRALVELTQSLLHDRVDQGRGVSAHRQVVLADVPSGRLVELWGLLDEHTAQVAVYVGGTGTTMRQFGWPSGIARALAAADPTGATAVSAWMGAPFPRSIGTDAPSRRFARLAAAPLRDHVEALDVAQGVPVTLVGHSYGGVIVGAAERLGVRADRVVHAGVPGVGPDVRSVADYAPRDPQGRPRTVRRYALTAPGDLIRLWQRSDAPLAGLSGPGVRAAGDWLVDRTLGADPMRLEGVTVLDTGVWEVDRQDRERGERLHGPRGHADVVEPGTTAFRRIAAIVTGGDPTEIRPR